MKCLWLQLWGELLAPLCPPSPFLNTGGYNPAKAPPPARMRHRDTHCETAQPAQGTPICCDHQLCICRLQSLNKAILTQQSEPFSSSCTPKASATSTPWFLQLCRSSLQASPPHSWWGREHFTWLTTFLQSEGNHSKLLSQGSTSPSYTRNVAHQRGHLQETTLSSHPAASLCRQGSDVQGNTHISQAFSVQGRTKRFGSYCKLTSQALECQSPSTSSVQSQVWHDCGTAMPQHGHRYQKSGPILLPDEKLHKEASITFINGFWPGKGASSSATGDSELLWLESKRLLLNSPFKWHWCDLIYSSQHIRLQLCFLRLWEGTCAVSQLPGHQAPQRPKALEPSLIHFLSSLIQDTLLIWTI